MITYEPFWTTLKKKEMSTYTLIKKYEISSSTIDRFRNNKPVTTTTLNDICSILDCGVADIMVYRREPGKNLPAEPCQ